MNFVQGGKCEISSTSKFFMKYEEVRGSIRGVERGMRKYDEIRGNIKEVLRSRRKYMGVQVSMVSTEVSLFLP